MPATPSAPLASLELSQQLERAEALSSARFIDSRRGLAPGSGAEWVEAGGVVALHDGAGSPVTQTFRLGLFEPATPSLLDTLERFSFSRCTPALMGAAPGGASRRNAERQGFRSACTRLKWRRAAPQ